MSGPSFRVKCGELHGNIAICSHGDFGRVLGARWIGLPVRQAQHFLLNTASLSVLGYEHDRIDEPAIILWNAAPEERSDSAPCPPVDDIQTVNQRAMERWENEAGEM